MEPKTPRQFVTGMVAVLSLWVLFYTWVFYAVLELPTRWVIILMSGLTVMTYLSGLYGYALWRRRNLLPPGMHTISDSFEIVRLAPMLGVSLLACTSAYLLWHRSRAVGWLLALVAAALSIQAMKHFNVATPNSSQANSRATIFDPIRGYLAFLVGFAAFVPLFFAVVFLLEGGVAFAGVLFAVFAFLLPKAVTKIKTILRSGYSTHRQRSRHPVLRLMCRIAEPKGFWSVQ